MGTADYEHVSLTNSGLLVFFRLIFDQVCVRVCKLIGLSIL